MYGKIKKNPNHQPDNWYKPFPNGFMTLLYPHSPHPSSHQRPSPGWATDATGAFFTTPSWLKGPAESTAKRMWHWVANDWRNVVYGIVHIIVHIVVNIIVNIIITIVNIMVNGCIDYTINCTTIYMGYQLHVVPISLRWDMMWMWWGYKYLCLGWYLFIQVFSLLPVQH